MIPEPRDSPTEKIPPRAGNFLGDTLTRPVATAPAPTTNVPPQFMDLDEVRAARRRAALTWHERNAFVRFRTAEADHPAVLDWVERFLLAGGKLDSLMLQGPVGCGKTHQAFGALRAIAASGIAPVEWQAVGASQLYRRLRPNNANDQDRVLSAYAGAPLLLLDDLGAEKNSTWVEGVNFQLVGDRYDNCLPTIFTTNLDTDTLEAVLGQRTFSRIVQTCTWVTFDGPDRRFA